MSSDGLTLPGGDPVEIRSAASALRVGASDLETEASRFSTAVSTVLAAWKGQASHAFETAASSVRSGLNDLSGQQSDAAGFLSTYASGLATAQGEATLANQRYEAAQRSYAATMAELAVRATLDPAAAATAAQAEQQAADTLSAVYAQACAQCEEARSDASQAASVCAAALGQTSGVIKSTLVQQFLDILSGPGAVLGTYGFYQQVAEWNKTMDLDAAVATDDWGYLKTLNPAAYKSLEAVLDNPTTTSAAAADAQQSYVDQMLSAQATENARAAAGFSLDGPGDVVGDAGLLLGVGSDVLVLVDGQSSTADKVMAGANLAGIGTVGATLAGVNFGTDWVPVVGEVVVAGTGLYFLAQWAQSSGALCHTLFGTRLPGPTCPAG
ncbi:MAG: WXG100 family type VII secretion target [Candidatus Dormibacteria bacterium]